MKTLILSTKTEEELQTLIEEDQSCLVLDLSKALFSFIKGDPFAFPEAGDYQHIIRLKFVERIGKLIADKKLSEGDFQFIKMNFENLMRYVNGEEYEDNIY
jgi:hypothetical protein